MKRNDLEFLIDAFLFKFKEKSEEWEMMVGYDLMRRCLKLFLGWCIEENLFDSESN